MAIKPGIMAAVFMVVYANVEMTGGEISDNQATGGSLRLGRRTFS